LRRRALGRGLLFIQVSVYEEEVEVRNADKSKAARAAVAEYFEQYTSQMRKLESDNSHCDSYVSDKIANLNTARTCSRVLGEILLLLDEGVAV